ncbi:MAG TPA: RHS repeat-associated core domain-containing protein [Candidatus Saccharimonadales bacterium]|nr:RHS repeat-associated core domain-containing protein [Candidatus Saccharimonadales bacterium]
MPNLKIRLSLIFFTFLYLFSSTVIPTFANISYTYDADGNMTSDGTYCYTYNEENQVSQVKNCGNNQVIAVYIYDYQGNRLIKRNYTNGTLNNTVYSPADEYETKKIAANNSTQNTTYYFANGQQIAKKNPDGTKTYVHNDDLGSSSVLTDASGAVTENTTYDPWGEVKLGGTKDKFQYTGQEKDSETGLNYYNFRYYNSHTRRFTQPDDIFPNQYDPQQLNRYSYVGNNPLTRTDPTGHFFVMDDIAEVMLVGGVVTTVAAPAMVVVGDSIVHDVQNHNYAGAANTASWFVPGIAEEKAGAILEAETGQIIKNIGANNAASGLKLSKALASESQMAEIGKTIAGSGTKKAFDNAAKAATRLGGSPNEYVKKSSTAFKAIDGSKIQTHWVENIITKVKAEFKTKISYPKFKR